VSVFPQLLLALVGGDFSQFAFSSAGHFNFSLSSGYKTAISRAGTGREAARRRKFHRIKQYEAGWGKGQVLALPPAASPDTYFIRKSGLIPSD
jgi:hypothetical protein